MSSRVRILRSIAIMAAGAAALIIAKLTIPFCYAERPVDPDAVSHVVSLQSKGKQAPEKIATQYLYFHGDHRDSLPKGIQISSKKINETTVRVKIFDPYCEDDSISSTIDRVYLSQDMAQRWVPVRVEWSHRGRGRFGWTTKPTT